MTRRYALGETKAIPDETYDELCRTLTDFENATDDETDEEWMSDGEWLDVFYELCVEIQRSIV